MKIVINTLRLVALAVMSASLIGCYTQTAIEERSNEYDSYSYSDTSADGKTVTINNNYFLDDDYRRSRFRVSFNYYYPTYHSSWISSYFYSYYDDPYWGFGFPPYSLTWYPNPWVYYPPYWYPPYWYHPYPYWTYHPYPYWYYNPGQLAYSPPKNNDGRYRNDGPERTNSKSDIPRERRPISVGSSGTSLPKGNDVGRRDPISERIPRDVEKTGERRNNETPWWERRAREENEQRERQPIARPREERREREVGQTERQPQQQERPRYVVPKEQPRQREADARQREQSRPSYNPEPQRTQAPSYTPPPAHSGGNSREAGTSQSGGGRKRAD